MSLTIVLVDCGLEIIPKQIRHNPSISRSISQKNYSSQLLDNALHHNAMKNLKNFEKRGRPDITHLCLLNALGSPLNKEEKLKLYIHTIHNKIFEINPKMYSFVHKSALNSAQRIFTSCINSSFLCNRF